MREGEPDRQGLCLEWTTWGFQMLMGRALWLCEGEVRIVAVGTRSSGTRRGKILETRLSPILEARTPDGSGLEALEWQGVRRRAVREGGAWEGNTGQL